MKTVVYITENKIWAGERAFDWDGVSMDEVFGKIKKELGVGNIRIVLGNGVSFVTAVMAGDTFLSRENILKLVKSWMPFEVDSGCFDWKQVVLGHDEIWIQIVAVEKELLMSLSSAVRKHGIKVDLITAIGVLMGEITNGRETPVILKWSNKENLSVLAINGLVDLVAADINEEDLMIYAKQKWGLAVNPEEIILNESKFSLWKNVFSEKTKGEDKIVLNLPILKEVVTQEKQGGETNLEDEVSRFEKEEVPRKRSKLRIYMVVLVVLVIGGVVFSQSGWLKSVFMRENKKIETVSPTPSPSETITPEPTVPDLSTFQVEVLNGSGVTGEAAKIKTILLESGFVKVSTGNTTATTEGMIRVKASVSESVIKMVTDSVTDYKMGAPEFLTASDKYDLMLVVGSAKKL